MGICFHGSTELHYRAMKATGWCDAFFLKPDPLVGGLTGSVADLRALKIDYNKYEAALIYQDGLGETQKYFVEQCVKHGVTVYANQHGFNKSIRQIIDGAPNIYSKYWNSTGKYFLDRFKEVTDEKPLSHRWISIGSLVHDYLYSNYRWDKNRHNGRALIIHEPDLRACEGDEHPHDSETITAFVIKELKKAKIPADFKPHPNWKNFIGNTGEPLRKPKGVNLVDIKVEDIVNYALVIGSRSSMLLEAAIMGVPALAVESTSTWEDDKYPPVEGGESGLIPTYSRKNFHKGLKKLFGKEHKYDLKQLRYYCGPVGKVKEKYYEFIKEDQRQPGRILGKKAYTEWIKNLEQFREVEFSPITYVKLKSRGVYTRILVPFFRLCMKPASLKSR